MQASLLAAQPFAGVLGQGEVISARAALCQDLAAAGLP